jgi:hypothetical protein
MLFHILGVFKNGFLPAQPARISNCFYCSGFISTVLSGTFKNSYAIAARKKGKKPFSKPSLPLAVERVVERSNDRVSNFTRDISANA